MPAGTQLRVHRGNLIITRPGTVIQGLDILGYVEVRARGVVIRDSIVRGSASGEEYALVTSASDSASLTIVDSELVASYPDYTIDGLRGWNINAARLNIHDVSDTAHFWGSGNVRLRDSWLHDTLHFESDPTHRGGPSHDDNIQIQSGSGYLITGNRIEGAYNAAIMITQDAGVTSNVMIRDNFLDGGGCTINVAQKSRPPLQNIDIVGNTFGSNSQFDCSMIVPATGDISTGGNATLSGGAPKIVIRSA